MPPNQSATPVLRDDTRQGHA